MAQRVLACGWLAQISGKEAKKCLRNLLVETESPNDLISLADIALRLHDWTFARSQFLRVARNTSAEPSERISAARGLGKVGLCEAGSAVLFELNLEDEALVSSAVPALISCAQEEKAVQICRNFLAKTNVDFLDRVEVAGDLGRQYRSDLGRSLIMEVLSTEQIDLSGQARAAEILNDLGYQSEARTILFDLQKQKLRSSSVDFDELLWVLDAMVSCNLHYSAKAIFDAIDRANVNEEALDRYEEIKVMLDESFFAD